jgi:hypothetical protein
LINTFDGAFLHLLIEIFSCHGLSLHSDIASSSTFHPSNPHLAFLFDHEDLIGTYHHPFFK